MKPWSLLDGESWKIVNLNSKSFAKKKRSEFLYYKVFLFFNQTDKLPNRLLKTDLITMPNSDCTHYLDEMKNSEFQFCAYDPEFKNDACTGDSGGPLQTFRAGSFVSTIAGVVSYGLVIISHILFTTFIILIGFVNSFHFL